MCRCVACWSFILYTMKRVLGVISCLLMLHLTLAGGDLPCAKHCHMAGMPEHLSPVAQVAHTEAAAHTENAPADDCRTPVKQDCCAALAACAVNIAAAASITHYESLPSARTILWERAVYAPLRVWAPEPPPPRA